jgi:hypothetical protein
MDRAIHAVLDWADMCLAILPALLLGILFQELLLSLLFSDFLFDLFHDLILLQLFLFFKNDIVFEWWKVGTNFHLNLLLGHVFEFFILSVQWEALGVINVS